MHEAGVELCDSFRERSSGVLAPSVDSNDDCGMEWNVHGCLDMCVHGEVVLEVRELLRSQDACYVLRYVLRSVKPRTSMCRDTLNVFPSCFHRCTVANGLLVTKNGGMRELA